MSDEELSENEVDEVLVIFDQTEPALQRQIVAGLVAQLAGAEEENQRLRALLRRCAKSMEECLDDITSPLRRGAAEMLLEGVRKEVGDG